jgi:ABC-type glycerol-3-phosphate transport system substrate-binding protein
MTEVKRLSRREFLAAAGSLAAGTFLAGCVVAPAPAPAQPGQPADQTQAAPSEAQAEPVTVRVAIMSAHGMSDSAEEIAKQFNEVFAPNKAEVTAIGFETLLDKMLQDFSTGANSFDTYSVGYHWIGTVGNYLTDLDEVRNANPDIVDPEYDMADFPKILWDTYATWQGKNIGLPFVDGTLTLFYRGDLFENPDYMEQFKSAYGYDLKMPKDGDDWRLTHQQLRDYAEFFHSGVKWREEGEQYGITLPAKVGDPLLSTYCTIFGDFRRSEAGIQAFGEVDPDWGDYFTNDHKVAYDPALSDLGLQALQMYMDIGQFSPNPANLDWITSSEPFRAGISAMFAGWGGYWPSLVTPDSPIVDKAQVTMLPMPHLGGWNVAINKATKNPAQTYQYIQLLTNKENCKMLYDKFTETPTRLSTMTDPELKAKNVDLWVMAPSLELCSVRPKIQVLPQMEQTMGAVLGQVWTGGLEPAEALAENAAQWTKIITDAGL